MTRAEDVAVPLRPSGRIADIEVLRAAAILMVLYEHVPFNLLYWHSIWLDINRNIWRGGAGVELFFTISGFVIARSLLPSLAARPPGAEQWGVILEFWLRRFWRLQPAAWFWVAAPILAGVAFNRSGAFHTVQANLAAALSSVLPINNLRTAGLMEVYKHTHHIDSGLSFPYWSLSLEEQFYVALPLLALAFRRHLGWLMLGLLVYQFVMPGLLVLTWTRPGPIAMGVLLAMGSRQDLYRLWEPDVLGRSRWARAAFLLVMLGLLGMVLSSLPQPTTRITFGLGAILSGGLVYAASFDRGYIMADGTLRRVLLWVAARSYALYLTHITAFAAAREIAFRWETPGYDHPLSEAVLLVSLGWGLAFVLADLSYRFIEEPCRRFGRSVTIRRCEFV